MKPTEGTILTVARVASEYADAAVSEGKDVVAVFEAMLDGAKKALDETPELLPVLKKPVWSTQAAKALWSYSKACFP